MLKFPTCKFSLGCAGQVLYRGPSSLAALEFSYAYNLGTEFSLGGIYYLGQT